MTPPIAERFRMDLVVMLQFLGMQGYALAWTGRQDADPFRVPDEIAPDLDHDHCWAVYDVGPPPGGMPTLVASGESWQAAVVDALAFSNWLDEGQTTADLTDAEMRRLRDAIKANQQLLNEVQGHLDCMAQASPYAS